MRVLLVLHQFYPEFVGGTERVALNLALSAQRAGHYVHVLACQINPQLTFGRDSELLRDAREFVYQGIPVTLLAKARLPALADVSIEAEPTLVNPLADWMHRKGFDLCHTLHAMRMGTAVLAAKKCQLPLILTLTDFFLACYRINLVNLNNQLCDDPVNGQRCGQDCLTAPWDQTSLVVRHRNARALLASASARITPSEFVANRYRQAFPDMSFRVIGHGIDVAALLDRNPKRAERTVSSSLRLGYVGSIIPQKGLVVLLQALARVVSQEIELVVIGGFHGAAAYHDEVKLLSKADPRVTFLGHLSAPEVYAAMRELDLLCLPSLVPETFSLALHEACALSVPALVSNLGAPGEWVEQYGAGEALPAGDVVAWAHAIDRLVHQPEQITRWRATLPLPTRAEEEAFFYESLYRTLLA